MVTQPGDPTVLALFGNGPGLAQVSDGLLAVESALEVLVTVVGLFVAYQAYRGYRRNDSRPMLFLAAGIGLMMCLHFGIRYPLAWVGLGNEVREFLIQVVDVVALGLIGYALVR
jgi:hypothetical protein